MQLLYTATQARKVIPGAAWAGDSARGSVCSPLSALSCDTGRMTSIQPELWVERAGQAVAFYADAFGVRVLHQAGQGDDIVAQLAVGEAVFWVAAAGPGCGRFGPVLQSRFLI